MFNGNDFPHELLLTTRQKTKLKNEFNNNISTDLKVSRAKISKIIQSGGFLWSLLSKLAGLLVKVAIPLAKRIQQHQELQLLLQQLMQEFKKKIHGSGTTTLAISNEEINYIMKIVEALKDSDILLKGLQQKNKKEDF